MTNKAVRHTLLVLLVAVNASLSLLAQNYQAVAPKALPNVEAVRAEPIGGANRPHAKGNETIIPKLKGLAFVADAKSIKSAGLSAPGLSVGNINLLKNAAFQRNASAYLGKPLTLDRLNQITALVVNFYRAHEHPVVDVLVPQQDLDSGVLQILVTEFRVGKVTVKGNKWFSNKQVVAPLKLEHGDTINSTALLEQLDAANSNPFRQVNLVYQPSSQAGYTDLVLETKDRLPLRAYTSYDNSGQPATGRSRWGLGVDWGNALWQDQQISYQFTSSSDLFTGRSSNSGESGHPSFFSHSLSWTTPLIGPGSITVFGAYEQSSPDVGQDLGLLGKSAQAGFRYNIALRRTQSFLQGVQFGYDFKTTNNDLDFGGTQVSRNQTEVDQFPVAYSARLSDPWGTTSMTTTLVYSPGGLTPNNNDSAFEPASGQSGRAYARAKYTYLRNDLNRLTKLPWNALWSVRAISQYSDRTLLDTERVSAGGPDLLRGYNPFSILGDEGVVLSNELRSRSFGRATGESFVGSLPGQVQFLGFWDFARLRNKNVADGDPHDVNASSVGMGLRYNLRSNMNLKFDYGWQLEHLPGTDGRNQLASLALVLGN